MNLFPPATDWQAIAIADGQLSFLERMPCDLPTGQLMTRLLQEVPLRAESITVWGKTHAQPRLTAWVGDAAYTYSGMTLAPAPWTPLLDALRQQVQTLSGHRFNSVLLNYYRDQRDSMGMHSDDEPELGPQPVIASLSLGATRTLILKHKRSGERHQLRLSDGSLLLMAGDLQANWRHGINKESRPQAPRLNLTFRMIHTELARSR